MVGRMRRFLLPLLLLILPALAAEKAPLEHEVEGIIAGPQVTIVHFWAPWCANCRNEMRPDGWAAFIAANPHAKFVFINLWHRNQDPQPALIAAGLGAQPNLVLRTHPNPSKLSDDRVNDFLGLPITWLPTTWVFREGKLRAALNYGEVRFPMLQQLINDARADW